MHEILLLERPLVELIDSTGNVIPYYTSESPPFKQPFQKFNYYRTFGSSGSTDFKAFWSGRRSVVIKEKNKWYRVKGCGLYDSMIDAENILDTGEPAGGQNRETATLELRVTEKINEIFENYKCPTLSQPVCRFDYRGQVKITSAGVYEIKGDTRADEILGALSKLLKYNLTDRPLSLFTEFSSSIGRYVGSLLSCLHENGLIWGTNIRARPHPSNAHLGNVVVYPDGENTIRCGLVDYDSIFLAKILGFKKPKLRKSEVRKIQTYEKRRLERDILTPHRSSIWNDKIILPNKMLEEMNKGFRIGYDDIDFSQICYDGFLDII